LYLGRKFVELGPGYFSRVARTKNEQLPTASEKVCLVSIILEYVGPISRSLEDLKYKQSCLL
jgi:hypothetical protein